MKNSGCKCFPGHPGRDGGGSPSSSGSSTAHDFAAGTRRLIILDVHRSSPSGSPTPIESHSL